MYPDQTTGRDAGRGLTMLQTSSKEQQIAPGAILGGGSKVVAKNEYQVNGCSCNLSTLPDRYYMTLIPIRPPRSPSPRVEGGMDCEVDLALCT